MTKSLRNAEVAEQMWVDTAQELGRDLPKPQGRLRYA